LVAKVSAILRREAITAKADNDEEPAINHNELLMNPNDFSVTIQGRSLALTAVEYKILYFLARKPGRVYTRERILEQVRGDDVIITGRTVDVHVLSLRRKLGDCSELIKTVRGVGYKLQE